MQVYLQALGCRLNEAELEAWGREFRNQGCEISDNPSDADLIVVNTCAVTAEAARKSRQIIRRHQRRNSRAKLVVSGCHATLEEDAVREIEGVDLVVPNPRKDGLADLALREFMPSAVSGTAQDDKANPLYQRGRQRAFVKVQDGCRHRCSFCIVTIARGEERNRDSDEIVAEIASLSEQGVQEAVLTGVHLGGYENSGIDLGGLIRLILQETDIPRLRLGSLEPWRIDESLLSCFENPRLLGHLHLPLQSGSDALLKRMARRCCTDDYTQLVESVRKRRPNFAISTDIIVGFPGETEALWQQSLDYFEKTDFSNIHIFPYSAREGTAAAKFPEQVPMETRQRRCRELRVLAAQMRHEFLKKQIASRCTVLWEGRESDGRRYGYTENYLPAVSAQEDTWRENQIAQVRIAGLAAGRLVAIP